jgi:hypothetical protein
MVELIEPLIDEADPLHARPEPGRDHHRPPDGRSEKRFNDQKVWPAHLDRLGLTALRVTPDTVRVTCEGALWGSVQSHKFLCNAVVLSDHAGQFDVGPHALCWVHAERLVHKLDTFTDNQRAARKRVRGLTWKLCADLRIYRVKPSQCRSLALRPRFDRIFRRRTGFATLDRLSARLSTAPRPSWETCLRTWPGCRIALR